MKTVKAICTLYLVAFSLAYLGWKANDFWARSEQLNLRLGPLSRKLAPEYGACRRCQTAWKFVEPHVTWYTPHEGKFPLCELCWRELGSPERRIPYYRQQWVQHGHGDLAEWRDMKAAVEAGG